MKIRSITCFFDPNSPGQLDQMALLVGEATRLFNQAGWEVETSRLAAPSFVDLLPKLDTKSAVAYARKMEADSAAHGFSYISLGPAVPAVPAAYPLIPPMLAATQNVFLTGVIATASEGISLPAVRACGEIIACCGPNSLDGFTNLRFAALANVPAFIPFFPAAYHAGGQPAFALAVECADAAVTAFTQAASLAEGRQTLLKALNEAGDTLGEICSELAERFGVVFKGFDFSLAPFPEDWCSLGGAIERLGVPAVGLLGSVTAGAILADTLDQGSWIRSGFNGLMLPVLEDSVMARSTAADLSIKDLLLFSTVCGAGLDTVPLPGDASPEQLSAVLLDVAALAVRLGKPLTARLMPIPGKKAGDVTEFNFGYFANGKVMALPASPLFGYLSGDEQVLLQPRHQRR